ncbi:hypothetical protein [Pseudidiomarina sp.]|uniref:hypothetical protein n=1 Tax=Pseudidiomarina sp. TaxID=2081707 RepID=UPI00299D67B8|nr:hypothetical protein [Pseudidiomarina sp.]MDX1706793.1 hypothetical protein [Pseudidiomarina sp.]
MTVPRKITLYNGNEKLSALSVPSVDGNGQALSMIDGELSRNPILTHAVFRDRDGKEWTIERHHNFFKKLMIRLMAK